MIGWLFCLCFFLFSTKVQVEFCFHLLHVARRTLDDGHPLTSLRTIENLFFFSSPLQTSWSSVATTDGGAEKALPGETTRAAVRVRQGHGDLQVRARASRPTGMAPTATGYRLL